jgi:hypothetical protein
MRICLLVKEGTTPRPGADAPLTDPRPLARVFFYVGFYNAGNLVGNSKYIPFLVAAGMNL